MPVDTLTLRIEVQDDGTATLRGSGVRFRASQTPQQAQDGRHAVRSPKSDKISMIFSKSQQGICSLTESKMPPEP